MADETSQISVALDALSTKIDEVSSSIGTAHDVSVVDSLGAINEQLNSLAAASNSILDGNVDYTSSIDRLSTLLAYGDMLLMVLIVFLAVGMGIYVGTIVTNWLKTRG